MKAFNAHKVVGVPQNLSIGRNGVIKYVAPGSVSANDFEAKLKKIL